MGLIMHSGSNSRHICLALATASDYGQRVDYNIFPSAS